MIRNSSGRFPSYPMPRDPSKPQAKRWTFHLETWHVPTPQSSSQPGIGRWNKARDLSLFLWGDLPPKNRSSKLASCKMCYLFNPYFGMKLLECLSKGACLGNVLLGRFFRGHVLKTHISTWRVEALQVLILFSNERWKVPATNLPHLHQWWLHSTVTFLHWQKSQGKSGQSWGRRRVLASASGWGVGFGDSDEVIL